MKRMERVVDDRIVEMTAEPAYKTKAHEYPRFEGECTVPWLVHASVVSNVSHQFEPDVLSILVGKQDEALWRIGWKIGHQKLTREELERVPRYYLVGRTSRGDVPAILGVSTGRFVVNQKVRDILEELEPGIQQFQPITVKAFDGKPIKGQETLPYYILMYPPPRMYRHRQDNMGR